MLFLPRGEDVIWFEVNTRCYIASEQSRSALSLYANICCLEAQCTLHPKMLTLTVVSVAVHVDSWVRLCGTMTLL
jgi:hypothetical protein